MLLMAVGALLALAGLVFTLQGMGMVGPDYSSMFESPAWIDQGIAVVAIGVIALSGGVWLSLKKARGP